MKKLFLILIAAALWQVPAEGIAQHAETPKGDVRLDAQKYMEILGATVSTLQQHFVDTVDWAKVLTAGIDAMLMELDPYTVFYNEEDQESFKTMTTGEYAGIGALIQQRGDSVMIAQPYENMPAAEAGLQIGDRILAIDGESMIGKTTAQVSEKLRGQPNTSFELKVLRPYENDPLVKQITRRKIVMDAVPYFGWLNDSIGYINLTQFTDKAALQVQEALESLRSESNTLPERSLQGIVLDLRSNGGGLIDEAVKIVGFFVPKGSVVVETRGRLEGNSSTYRTNTLPIEPDVKMAVLIDRSSASASEIVSGALQDLDRAVILGERSFGKGLVQSTRPLPYNTLVKFTSAKYYIPSGRCVQAIDYQARRMARWEAGEETSEDLGRIPDSLTHVFHTANGREVRDGGGIKPDVERKRSVLSNLSFYLEREYEISDYSIYYHHNHAELKPLTDADYAEFCQRVEQSRKDTILKALKINLAHDLDSLKQEVIEQLEFDLALHYGYQRAQIKQALKHDDLSIEAGEILLDDNRYHQLLSAPVADKKANKIEIRKTRKSKK